VARKLIAEALGTFMLVFIAVGTAVAGIKTHGTGFVAIAFGMTLIFLVYSIGPISGCHVNPAVTIAMVVSGRQKTPEAAAYMVAQVIGAIVGAGVLKLFVSSFHVTDETGSLGTNNWGPSISEGGALVLEILLTFVFVYIILRVTEAEAVPGFAGLAIGAALLGVHLVGIPLDGTSVNPARSLGPALFNGGSSLAHVWLFIVAPLIGGVVAGAVHMATKAKTTA
jgi:aquaporin Z